MIRQHITGIIIGICLTITVLAVWGMFKMQSQIINTYNVAVDAQSKANAVIDYINKAQQPK